MVGTLTSGAALKRVSALFSRVSCIQRANVRTPPKASDKHWYSETEGGELLVELLDSLVAGSLGTGSNLSALEFVELGGLDLTLGLELGNECVLLPASLLSEIAESAERSIGLHSLAFKGVWHNHSLLVVIRERNALKDSETAESGGTDREFVWEHAAGDLPENA